MNTTFGKIHEDLTWDLLETIALADFRSNCFPLSLKTAYVFLFVFIIVCLLFISSAHSTMGSKAAPQHDITSFMFYCRLGVLFLMSSILLPLKKLRNSQRALLGFSPPIVDDPRKTDLSIYPSRLYLRLSRFQLLETSLMKFLINATYW